MKQFFPSSPAAGEEEDNEEAIYDIDNSGRA
jgi:hypothetical protein